MRTEPGWGVLVAMVFTFIVVLLLDARIDDLEYQVCQLTVTPPVVCLP